MEKFIGIIITVTIITFSTFVTRKLFGKLKNDASKSSYKLKNIIKQPKLYLWVGIGFTIICLGLGLFFLLAPEKMIANYDQDMRLPVFIFFLVTCIPGVYTIVLQLFWKIEIRESSFTFRNSLGVKREYQFMNIEIKYKKSCTRFYQNGKHIVGISFLQENFAALDCAIEIFKSRNKNKIQNME